MYYNDNEFNELNKFSEHLKNSYNSNKISSCEQLNNSYNSCNSW